MFNALRYTKQLEQVGLTREQAETHIQIMTEVMESNLATKFDIRDTKSDINDLKNEISKFESQFAQFESKLVQLEYRLLVKLGVLLSSIMTLGFTAVSLVIKFH